MATIVEKIEKEYMKKNISDFRIGDSLKVHIKIIEGEKERIQIFEGIAIARKGGGVRETFTVRKISFNVGVERKFPLHSPRIEKIEVIREGKVRRAKLYYLRKRKGKAAKITKTRRTGTA